MLKRSAEADLDAFLESDEKKCLVIRGARQVGKTYLVREAGRKRTGWSFIEVNFLEQPQLKDIFSGSLDIAALLLNFSVMLPSARFVPGKTLLLLDEIQECPEAVTSLKFWAEDGRFRVVATGSMLGIDYKRPSSYPVGAIRYLGMYPLGFREFLWAEGVDESAVEAIKGFFMRRESVPRAVHEQMMKYLKLYMIVGGMPDVVNRLVETGDIREVDKRQREILSDYRYDIAHYASPDIKIKAEKCYFSLPRQLSKANHKFQYSVVEKGSTKRKYGSSIDWLEQADLVTACASVSKIEFPLDSFADSNSVRLYPLDTGLLLGMFDYSVKMALMNDGTEESPVILQAKGGIYEALVADILTKNGHRNLYFYKNDTTAIEIEFLIQSDAGIVPIEVKAGNNRSRSLDRILKKNQAMTGYKLIDGNVGVSDRKVSIPLYMAMFL